MSTKLNAEELAAKICTHNRFEAGRLGPETVSVVEAARTAICVKTIREVAQPLADQRDELLWALKEEAICLDSLIKAIDALRNSPKSLYDVLMEGVDDARQRLTNHRATIAKCTPKE